MSVSELPALTLAQGLAALSLEELAAIAGRLGLSNGLTSKARLLATIPERFGDAPTVRKLLRDLAPPEIQALLGAVACERLAPHLGAGTFYRFGVAKAPEAVVARGLLLPDVNRGVHRPPCELEPLFEDEAAKRLAVAVVARPAWTLRLPAGSAFRDAVNIWCYVVKNGLPLTQSGAAPKRQLAKLVPLLEVPEEDETFTRAMEAFGVSRLELLVNDLYRREAFVTRDGELVARRWLEAGAVSADAFARDLVAAALAGDSGGGAATALYRAALLPAGKCGRLADIIAAARAIWPAATPEAIRQALFAAFVAGWLDIGMGDDGGLCIGPLSPAPAAEAAAEAAWPEILVGGNFELKVPSDLPLAMRLKLEAFADQVGGGHFLSFNITKQSAYRAFDAGVGVDEVVTFLAAHAGKPLPQNVEFSLRDWAAQYGLLSFRDGLLAVAHTPELADEIANLPGVGALIRGRRELHALEVAPRDYAAFREALLTAGYLPASLPARGDAVSSRDLFEGLPAAGGEGGGSVKAVVEFAVANRRRVELRLYGEAESVIITPERLAGGGEDARLEGAGPAGRARIPLAAIERATLI